MATLLVIGGTGFVGKSVLDAFGRGRLEPWGVDRVIALSRNARCLEADASELVTSRVRLVTADMTKADDLPEADVIMHAAADVDSRLYSDSDALGDGGAGEVTRNFCEIARRQRHPGRIVFISSGAVYGRQPRHIDRLTEEGPAELEGLPGYKRRYAADKIASESLIRGLGADGLHVSIARCFSLFGRWLPRDRQYAIGNFIEDGLHGRPIRVTSPKQVFRSYMHADDLVDWLMAIALHAGRSCPVYNVGSDEAVELRSLAGLVAAHYGVAVDAAEVTDMEPDRYLPAVEKARKELGVELTCDLRRGLQQVIPEVNRMAGYE